jgi:GT2 family glycosyltransferase
MEVSFLIVTRERLEDLEITLSKLYPLINTKRHEVLVFIDDCSETEKLIPLYNWVKWEISEKSIGASPARNKLYKKATGSILIGLDDDAHPLTTNFIALTKELFFKNPSVGIIAFQEIRGVFLSDTVALQKGETITSTTTYFTNDFVGSGFAIQKEVYDKTNGFPVWVDMYGEESCVAIEVIDLGYEILYTTTVSINHRVDKIKRLNQGRSYFRFEKQLRNTINYYIVYYSFPLFKVAKLLFHNFRKYALKDKKYFALFFNSIFLTLKGLFFVLKFRKPVQKNTIQKMRVLKNIKY